MGHLRTKSGDFVEQVETSLKGDRDQDRLMPCMSGMLSESCWMESILPCLESQSLLHVLGHCPHCLPLWFLECVALPFLP